MKSSYLNIDPHCDNVGEFVGVTDVTGLLKELFVGKYYYFQGRMFCQKNVSFENFISKVKKYYANKIKNYKSIKSLNYRRLHGKYPRFI